MHNCVLNFCEFESMNKTLRDGTRFSAHACLAWLELSTVSYFLLGLRKNKISPIKNSKFSNITTIQIRYRDYLHT